MINLFFFDIFFLFLSLNLHLPAPPPFAFNPQHPDTYRHHDYDIDPYIPNHDDYKSPPDCIAHLLILNHQKHECRIAHHVQCGFVEYFTAVEQGRVEGHDGCEVAEREQGLQEEEGHLQEGDPREVHSGGDEQDPTEEEPCVVVEGQEVRKVQGVVKGAEARRKVMETAEIESKEERDKEWGQAAKGGE